MLAKKVHIKPKSVRLADFFKDAQLIYKEKVYEKYSNEELSVRLQMRGWIGLSSSDIRQILNIGEKVSNDLNNLRKNIKYKATNQSVNSTINNTYINILDKISGR